MTDVSPGSVLEARRAFAERLFPEGVPSLWCPLLTHYDKDGTIDEQRMLAHLDHVANWLTGILVPGSTGDGWQLSEAERLRVLGLVLDQATRLKLRILVAVLKKDMGSARACLVGTIEWLKSRTGEEQTERCLLRRRIAGFTFCPPAGAHWTQEQLGDELESLLTTGLPIAFYEIPQVTGSSLGPDLVRRLAVRNPNFILFKDSSGVDAVAPALPPDTGVFLVRGAEGDYTRWLRKTGGPYDGLLLSSANCFGRELHRMLRDLSRNRTTEAGKTAARLTQAMRDAFALVQDLPEGNPFANANKAIDHYQAFGPHADQVSPPLLHGGHHLPIGVVRDTGDLLKRYDLLPEKGYLE